MKHPGKFRTHWIGPYDIVYVTKGGVVQLNTLNEKWKEIFFEWEPVEILL
jgi:hypothetical protein